MTKDPVAYREGIARFFRLADLFKCSDEDLEYLHPEWTDRAVETFIETYSPQLCVYTQGAEGLRASTKFGVSAQVSAFLPGFLSDTVGAGDLVHGTLLSEIDRLGLIGQQLSELNESQLTKILLLASRVAGVNCTRAGCQPPTRKEVLEMFG